MPSACGPATASLMTRTTESGAVTCEAIDGNDRRVVQVLLSTFNGERYLPALLDSLVGQTYPHVSILARDDESSDGTTAVLERYAASGHLIWYQGPHLGVRRSFFELLARADATASAFAFCDQDDVWLPHKLARVGARLDAEGRDEPVLYCGRAHLVDERLRPIGHTASARRGPSLRNALVENIAPGCTMVLNARARSLLVHRVPRGPVLHDAWAYLVVAALGRVIYDDEPAVLYRQHSANAIGAKHPRWRWRLARLGTIRQDRLLRPFVGQAAELERLYGQDLDPDSRRTVERFVRGRSNALAALKYALAGDVYRQTAVDNLILKMLIALRQL